MLTQVPPRRQAEHRTSDTCVTVFVKGATHRGSHPGLHGVISTHHKDRFIRTLSKWVKHVLTVVKTLSEAKLWRIAPRGLFDSQRPPQISEAECKIEYEIHGLTPGKHGCRRLWMRC